MPCCDTGHKGGKDALPGLLPYLSVKFQVGVLVSRFSSSQTEELPPFTSWENTDFDTAGVFRDNTAAFLLDRSDSE